MEYQGRSPLKDITRSVVLGAAMVPAALLAGCTHHADQPPPNPPPNPQPVGGTADVAAAQPDAAPPPEVVRPRTPENTNPNMMPTRGFAGAVRRVRG